ncbi:hypothetical protein R1sor_008803 [Riccia sorocarpa]|uniref:Uncharacterized protein n=1 Tax=Riccia sorocarpa TaxID=122646 RepID=A0ABD3HX94_9MARC
MTSIWNQGTKAERFHHRSVSNSCYDDPIPKYISPELVMLIAQNAPSELDVFKMSPTNRSRVLTSTWVCDLSGQELSSETKNNVEATSEMDCGVQVILPSSEETKKTVKNQRTGCHSSSDIMMKADHADGGGSEKANKVRRKRSAPTTPELYNSDSRNTNQLIPESSSSPKSRSKRQYGMHSSSKSVDLTSGIKRKSEEDRPLSAPVVDAEMYHFDALKAKPWRHGMGKKQKSTEPKSCEKISSKRNVDLDERKKSELKKYMATKFGQLRKERKLQEARAAAAEVAQKEKQRRLDAECQALLKSQAAEVKSKQKVLSRPPWISTEYVTLAESFRPWSSVSTGDLPPPKVPENQEPVPLDLYTSITGEAVQESAISNKRRFKKKRQSEKLTMTEAKKQLKGSDIPSNVNEMAFCPAPPYHALHPSPDPRTPKKTSILTKARWKSKGRSLKTFNTHKMYQLQLSAKPVRKGAVDLLAYKKIAKISHMPQNGSFSRETRSTRLPKQSRSFSRNGYSNVLQQDDRYAVTVLKEHERNLSARSKIKIPKETYNATAGHTFLQKLDCNPIKHSRVESGQRRGEDIKLKKISLYNMAKVMDPELSNHSNRVENHKTAASVSPISCKVHSEKSGRRVSLSPNELLRDEAAFQALKPESDSLCVEKHSRDRRTEHFAVHRGKGTAGVDADITKDSALAIRRQRMHMLRGLAEQLLKRLDAACAEHFQNTPKTVSERILESHIDTSDDLSKEQLQNVMNTEPAPTFELHLHTADKPFSESVVLHCLDESLTIELKPYHHFKKPDLLYQGDLSEKEQAGVENFNLLGEKVISSKIPSEQNEIYSHCNLRDKDLCVVKIIPLGGSSSSSGSSSPSFCSEQIPDGVKDRLKNGKHGQKLEEENSKKRPKEVWTLPVEEDPYSVINLYTEHWFSKKKKSRVRSELAGIGQCGDENISSAAKVFTPSHERAQKKHKFKSGSASNCNQLEMSESCIRSAEISCTRSKNGIESSAAQGDEQRYLRESAVSTSSTSSHFGKSVDTTVLGPMKEDNSQNDLPPGDSQQN